MLSPSCGGWLKSWAEPQRWLSSRSAPNSVHLLFFGNLRAHGPKRAVRPASRHRNTSLAKTSKAAGTKARERSLYRRMSYGISTKLKVSARRLSQSDLEYRAKLFSEHSASAELK